MSTMGERLRQAREAAGFDTASEAAEAMGIPVATYTQHENGTRGYPAKKADRYAEFFRTSTEWLIYGRKPRISKSGGMTPVIGLVGANPNGEVLYATGDSPNAFTPPPPGATDKSVALEVRGHSMHGIADDGALIYFEDQHTPPTEDMVGQVVVLETEGGEVLVKRLLRGNRKGSFDLQSLVGDMRRDVRVRWAAHISAIVPPHMARKVIRRTGEAA